MGAVSTSALDLTLLTNADNRKSCLCINAPRPTGRGDLLQAGNVYVHGFPGGFKAGDHILLRGCQAV